MGNAAAACPVGNRGPCRHAEQTFCFRCLSALRIEAGQTGAAIPFISEQDPRLFGLSRRRVQAQGDSRERRACLPPRAIELLDVRVPASLDTAIQGRPVPALAGGTGKFGWPAHGHIQTEIRAATSARPAPTP